MFLRSLLSKSVNTSCHKLHILWMYGTRGTCVSVSVCLFMNSLSQHKAKLQRNNNQVMMKQLQLTEILINISPASPSHVFISTLHINSSGQEICFRMELLKAPNWFRSTFTLKVTSTSYTEVELQLVLFLLGFYNVSYLVVKI